MPIRIRGKEYKTVAERVHELHATAEEPVSIRTELLSWQDGRVIVKATISVGESVYTGHAYEDETRSQINETSALENCETSAIGRALAAAGHGGTEYASADELANALKQQNVDARPDGGEGQEPPAPKPKKPWDAEAIKNCREKAAGFIADQGFKSPQEALAWLAQYYEPAPVEVDAAIKEAFEAVKQ